jgi:hypothetical protein
MQVPVQGGCDFCDGVYPGAIGVILLVTYSEVSESEEPAVTRCALVGPVSHVVFYTPALRTYLVHMASFVAGITDLVLPFVAS